MVGHITEVAEGVHRLTNGIANFYLIEEAGKLVLVDAGAPKDWALFTQAAPGLGKVARDLDAVLLTHAHTHHTGFAEKARATTGAQVWIHEQDAQMACTGKVGPRDGKTSAYLLHGAFWRTVFVLGMHGAAKIIPIQEVSAFGDGEVLDVPGSPRPGPEALWPGKDDDTGPGYDETVSATSGAPRRADSQPRRGAPGGPAGFPPPATTTRPGPELAARTG